MEHPRFFLPLGGMVGGLTMLLVFLATASPSRASDDPKSRATLQGVPALQVVAEVETAIAKGAPALKQQLQQEVADRLREAGIAVTSTASESLHVAIHAHDILIGYTFAVQVELEQPVQLVRGTHIVALAPTWGIGGMGTIPDLSPASLGFLRQSIADGVSEFINAYLQENSREEDGRF